MKWGQLRWGQMRWDEMRWVIWTLPFIVVVAGQSRSLWSRTSVCVQLLNLMWTVYSARLHRYTWWLENNRLPWVTPVSDISQGSVATRLRCGEMFNGRFIADLLLNLTVKEFWKFIIICRNYEKNTAALFWLRVASGPAVFLLHPV